jgi:molybdopterin-guanine dinucleotide biosynthesis protein A
MKNLKPQPPDWEACILAGGLSSRMGRDKSRLRLAGRTMTGHLSGTLKPLGVKVRVVRRDSVARCGPIGGILTALMTGKAGQVMVFACDMPFVSTGFIRKLLAALRARDRAVFAVMNGRAGFPCLLRRESSLPVVLRQIEAGEFSLQKLAAALRARKVQPRRTNAPDLLNINTPAEFELARRSLKFR